VSHRIHPSCRSCGDWFIPSEPFGPYLACEKEPCQDWLALTEEAHRLGIELPPEACQGLPTSVPFIAPKRSGKKRGQAAHYTLPFRGDEIVKAKGEYL